MKYFSILTTVTKISLVQSRIKLVRHVIESSLQLIFWKSAFGRKYGYTDPETHFKLGPGLNFFFIKLSPKL